MIRLEIPEDEGDGDRKATIWARSEETGSNRVEVEMAECSGAGIRIAFSSRYLMELVSAVGTEHVVLETTGPSSQGSSRPWVRRSAFTSQQGKAASANGPRAGRGAQGREPTGPLPFPQSRSPEHSPNPEGRRT